MERAIITNIQKYSVHDGPGIRTTVFFKGCPLSCRWCHNPETQSFNQQFMYDLDKCSNCGECIRRCTEEAVYTKDKKVFTDMKKCTFCETCMDFCITGAREIVGREYSVQEILKEIEKDRRFYEESGGGVTLSGGEAMMNIDFIEELINLCNERGISVVVDTCGYAPYENFHKIKDKVQVFLYDVKLMEDKKHREYTGQGNFLILDNLRKLSQQGANINLRLPLIEGINTDEENIKAVIKMAKENNIKKINLLPYHDIGKDKYRKLNRLYEEEAMSTPSEETLNWIKDELEKNNFQVKIGG